MMYSEVTFWRPKIGTSIKRKEEDLGAVTTPVTTPATTPVTTLTKKRNEGKEVREKIFRIIRSSPTISKLKIADLCGLKKEGIRYHIEILREEVGLRWEGNSQNGRWKWDKECT